MTNKTYSITKLFEAFIRDSKSGNRLRYDGKRIKKDSLVNYASCLNLLQNFDNHRGTPVEIRPKAKYSKGELVSERKYWKKFYTEFTTYLYKNGCFDNYVGSTIKCLRTFFNYLEHDKYMSVGNFHKDFFVVQQEIPIITLMPEQLHFLIHDKEFEANLPIHLKRTKDIFITGSTVALRYSDLIKIGWQNIEARDNVFYLSVRSKKSDTPTRVLLPPYVANVLNKYKKFSKHHKSIFPPLCLQRFNINLRAIMLLAGYVQPIGKSRNQQGIAQQQLHPKTKKPYRFCDLVSSHTMRRTAVTTMLMNGVPEFVVKQISGHSQNSRSFSRYVNLAQSFMDCEISKHFEKMNATLTPKIH